MDAEQFAKVLRVYNSLKEPHKTYFSQAITNFIEHINDSLPSKCTTFVKEEAAVRPLPTAKENKRLDSLARLIVGNEVCAVATLFDDKLYFTSNRFQAEGTESPLQGRLTSLLSYFGQLQSMTQFHEAEIINSIDLIYLLLSDRLQESLKTTQDNCNYAVQRSVEGITLPNTFWKPIHKTIENTLKNLLHSLASGFYYHKTGYEQWDNPDPENLGVLNRVFEKYGLGTNLQAAKVGSGVLIPNVCIDTLLRKTLGEATYTSIGRREIKKKINADFKKLLADAIQMYSDFALVYEYIMKPDSPMRPIIDNYFVDTLRIIPGDPKDHDKEVHAEMKLIDFLEREKLLDKINYIGISKLSCPYCKLVLYQYIPDIEVTYIEYDELKVLNKVRGHHSNFNVWPISEAHLGNPMFMTALLGPSYGLVQECDFEVEDEGERAHVKSLLILVLQSLIKLIVLA